MARQITNPKPYIKHMEAYRDFSGGLNTVTTNDNMLDNELLGGTVNIDLGERGSLSRRSGMVRHLTTPTAGFGQGYFRYFKTDGNFEELLAVNGKLLRKKVKVSDPTTAPTVVTQTDPDTTTALAAGTYYVRYTWLDVDGETLASPNTPITISAGQEIKVTLPTFPTDVVSANVYISTTSGSETKQGNTTTTTYVQSGALVAGSALPTTNTTSKLKEIAITNLASFQTTRQVEAVQHKDKLYIATGTKLVVYDGTSAAVVVPYKPEPLEALYIGTNGLADNPDQYLADGTATYLRIEGVIPSKRYGVSNKALDFTVYVSSPSGSTIEYRMEFRKAGSNDAWVVGRDWGTNKKITHTFKSVGTYEIKFLARVQGSTATPEEYYLPQYTVETTDKNTPISTSTIHSCNRIVLHWNRVILYGDTTQKDVIYISHLDNPAYVPTPNSLRFENERQEGITALVQFRDMLVAFTPTSIQALYGKAPIGDDPYRRVMLSSAIGCIAGQSAKVMGNYVAFLSQEGVHILKSLGYTENRLNVEKIDNKIANIVPRDTDACGVVLDGQYHLVFPQSKERFRYYYEDMQAWVKDTSTKLDFSRLYEWGGILYGQSKSDGHIRKFDSSLFADEEVVYQDVMELKNFDFGHPYNPKKLKELQMLFGTSTDLSVYVYADSGLVINPDTSYATVENGSVVWKPRNAPNVEVASGTIFGSWVFGESHLGNSPVQLKKLEVSGKCLRTKLKIVHELNKPNQLLGFGYIYRIKKP